MKNITRSKTQKINVGKIRKGIKILNEKNFNRSI
jgi:hypothetical protein